MELNRTGVIDRLQSGTTSIDNFNYDKLTAPPLSMLLSQYDVDSLYNIATSLRYAGNVKKKYKAIDEILTRRDFSKLAAGTNRLCYRFIHDDGFIVKVAYDSIAIHDSPAEFNNQFILKPFCTKVFEVDPCGVVGSFERVDPITSREEFLSVADDAYDLIDGWLLNNGHIMADIGSKYFMNYGLRRGFGLVVIDFPYLYEIDGRKIFCSSPDSNSSTGICGGQIDFDKGFNELHCQKCGTRYRVKEISKDIEENKILIKGGTKVMKPRIVVGGKVIQSGDSREEFKAAASKVSAPPKRNNVNRTQQQNRNVKPKVVVSIPGRPAAPQNKVNKPSDGGYTKPSGKTNMVMPEAKKESPKKIMITPVKEDHRGETNVTTVKGDDYDVLKAANVTPAEEQYVKAAVVEDDGYTKPATLPVAQMDDESVSGAEPTDKDAAMILETYKEEIAASKEVIAKAKHRAATSSTNIDVDIELEACKRELAEAKERIANLQAAASSTASLTKDYQDNLRTARTTNYKLLEKINDLESTLKSNNEALERKEARIEELLEEKEARIRELEVSNGTHMTELSEMKNKLRNYEINAEGYQGQIDDLNRELSEKNSKLEDFRNNNELLLARIKENQSVAIGWEQECNELKQKITELEEAQAVKLVNGIDTSMYDEIVTDSNLKIGEMETTIKALNTDLFDFCDFALRVDDHIIRPTAEGEDYEADEIEGAHSLNASIYPLSSVMTLSEDQDQYVMVFNYNGSLLCGGDGKVIIVSSINGIPVNDIVLNRGFDIMDDSIYEKYFSDEEGEEDVAADDDTPESEEVNEDVERTDAGEN